MPPDDPNDSRPTGNGAPVTNKDLKIVVLEMDNKLDKMLSAIGNMQKWQDEYRDKIDRSADEILNLRDRGHDLANKMQAMELRTAPITLSAATELVAGLPQIRRGLDLLQTSDLKLMLSQDEANWIKALIKREADEDITYARALKDLNADTVIARAQKEQEEKDIRDKRWFGVSRDVVVAAAGLILFLLITTLWAYARHAYFGIP